MPSASVAVGTAAASTVSSSVDLAESVAIGASLTPLTVMVTVLVAEAAPSLSTAW